MVFYNPYNYGPVTGINAALGMAPYAANYFRGGAFTNSAAKKRARSRGATQTLVTSKRQKKSGKKSFHSLMVQNTPAKHYTNAILQTLTHSTMYFFAPPQQVVLGDAYNQRDGDYIDLIALKLKGIFQTPTASNAYSYRLIVGYSGEEYTGSATGLTVGLTDAEVFLPNTSGNWTLNGIVNAKAFTSIYDQTFDINSMEASTVELQSFSVTVPLNKKFPYQANASIFGKDKNLYVFITSGVAGGSSGVTASGTLVCGYDLIFKSV